MSVMFTTLLAAVPTAGDLTQQLTSLGSAGLMGWMWLWERRTSRAREEQLDEAHSRILSDQVQLDALLQTIRNSTEALARLAASQEQMNRTLEKERT